MKKDYKQYSFDKGSCGLAIIRGTDKDFKAMLTDKSMKAKCDEFMKENHLDTLSVGCYVKDARYFIMFAKTEEL